MPSEWVRLPRAVERSRLGRASMLMLCALFACSAHAADPRESGPRTLIITYHLSPANRLSFRQELERSVVRQFHRWRQEGALETYRILFNRYVDSANWDAMALVSFGKESDLERWRSKELEAPAGLPPKALSLVTSIDTTPADLMRSQSAVDASDNAVFLVIPYEYVVPVDDYIAYLDGYVVPQLAGWMQEGIVSRYGIYLARYPAGRPWQSLLVLEYRNDQALGARDAVVAKVRARLKEDPKWKAISDGKKNVRIEKSPVLADPMAAN